MSDPVADGRKALNQWSGYPWYDAKTDGVRRIEIQSVQSGHDKTSSVNLDVNPLGGFLQTMAWLVLALIFAWLLYLLFRAFQQREKNAKEKQPSSFGGADRVDALPLPVAGYSDFLAEAERCRQRGDYSRALVFLFSHQLVRLDRRGRIHLSRGKTNRQYLREVRPWPAIGRLFEPTMILFEEVFFGHRTIDAFAFDACWARLGEFETIVESG